MRHPPTLLRHLAVRHLTACALLALLPVTARAEEFASPKPRVLVLPWTMSADLPVDSATANSILAARMNKVPVFNVVSQEELASMLAYQQVRQQLGNDTEQDMAILLELGRQAEADKLISGVMSNTGGTVVSSIVVIDVAGSRVEKRVAGTSRMQRDHVIPLLNGQADALLAYLLKTYAPERIKQARAAPAATTPPTKTTTTRAPQPVAATQAGEAAPRALKPVGAVVSMLGVGVGMAAAGAAVMAGTALAMHALWVPVTSENAAYRWGLWGALAVGTLAAFGGGVLAATGAVLWLTLPGGQV